MIAAGLAIIAGSLTLLVTGAILAWDEHRYNPGRRKPRRRLMLTWRWRHTMRPRLDAAHAWLRAPGPAAARGRVTGTAWPPLSRLTRGAASRFPAHLPRRREPHTITHASFEDVAARYDPWMDDQDGDATLAWVQAVKAPSPHAGWLHLTTASAVWRALARQLEIQATRPWDDPTGTFSRTALNAALTDGDQ
ncbi:MAG TPA: hypothetical protein VH641_14465 [Streptosporangiaceae bacterium]